MPPPTRFRPLEDLAPEARPGPRPCRRCRKSEAAPTVLAAAAADPAGTRSWRLRRQVTEEQDAPLLERGHRERKRASLALRRPDVGPARRRGCAGTNRRLCNGLIANDSPAVIRWGFGVASVTISGPLRPSGNALAKTPATVTLASHEPVRQGVANGPKHLGYNLLTTIRIASRRSVGTVAFRHLPLACFGNRFRAHRPQSRREFELRQSTDRHE